MSTEHHFDITSTGQDLPPVTTAPQTSRYLPILEAAKMAAPNYIQVPAEQVNYQGLRRFLNKNDCTINKRGATLWIRVAD